MIKLTAKEISELIGCKESYVYQLLKRKKIKLKSTNTKDLIDLICKYRREE